MQASSNMSSEAMTPFTLSSHLFSLPDKQSDVIIVKPSKFKDEMEALRAS